MELQGKKEKKKSQDVFFLFFKLQPSAASSRNAAKTPLLPFFIHPWVQLHSPRQANVFVLYGLECYFTLLSGGKWREICNLIITTAPPRPWIPLLCQACSPCTVTASMEAHTQ